MTTTNFYKLFLVGMLGLWSASCGDDDSDKGEGANSATNSATNSGTNSGTNSNTNSGTNSNTNSGTNSNTNSGTNSATNSGTNSSTNSNTNSGTNSNTNSGTNSGTNSELTQYTPDQANWDTFATKPFESGTNTSHDPDGVGWISAADWAAAEWDGTIYNPSKMTPQEFASAMCPSVDRVRGIREVFYQHQPFADNQNPTKAEIDEWHRIAINHVRALIGYTSEDRQVQPDHCMFARALWGDERKFTTMWDADYPGVDGSAAGPCQSGGNAHCGASFLPSPEDQAPYLPDGHPACTLRAGAEGVFSGPKSNIPWSIKWSRGFCNTLMAEGFWGGHVGPWFHREKFGFSFWDPDPSNNNNNAILRAKWTGALMPSLYCNPSDANCDPETTGPGGGM